MAALRQFLAARRLSLRQFLAARRPAALRQFLAARRPAARQFLTNYGGLLVCALFALAGLALAGDYGLYADEMNQRRIAAANLNYIRGQADSLELLPDPHALYGAAFELPLLLAERALGLTDYYYIHRLRLTLTHLFFILGGFFCYRLAWRLFGSRPIALLALLIYLLHPRIYAHAFFNSKDPVFLSMFVLTLYLLERAFRRDTLGAFLLLGMAAGLLTNLRIMGIMLLAAPLAMRGMDWLQAGPGPERKRILQTAALFALAAGLTLYAVTPYAWTNPVDYMTANLALTVNHPAVWPQLFQGNWLLSNALPPHYAATWFSITTPPLIMLLGLVGAVAAAAAALRRPAAVFRNTRRRLQLLLLACFLLPPLAAALLGSNQYENWRQLYFVYAPFGLLAAGGGAWLAAALARRRLWRVGAYGLVGTGLGLILLQMAQIHPLQYDYFNFLVDRTAPEYLRTQYRMDQWELGMRPALLEVLESHSEPSLALRVGNRETPEMLPPAARQRLRPLTSNAPAEYELTPHLDPGRPDLAFNTVYRYRLYNNTLAALRPLNAARMTPAARAAYRDLYRQATAGQPIIRADYAVYLNDRRLTFVKENCPAPAPEALFTAKFFPHRPETLPPAPEQHSTYLTLSNRRVQLDNLCLAVIQLPAQAQGDLMLTQRSPGGGEGSYLYSLSPPGLRELIADYRQNLSVPPATGSGQTEGAGAAAFEVFLDRDDGRNRLLYAKDACAQAEYETAVTLHIYPVNLADLPDYQRGQGYETWDFYPSEYGIRLGGECMAIVALPDYPIAAIRTGRPGSWEVNLYPPADPDYLRAIYAVLAGRPPNLRANFDLYLQDNRLVYVRETCTAADTAADFFLHIIPQDLADLPAERRAAGFANSDFVFARYGGSFDGKCLAAVPLPEYPIKTIRTGQFLPGQGDLWAAELAGGR